MARRLTLVAVLTLAVVAAGGAFTRVAAQASRSFTVDQILGYPFPEHLIASPTGSAIAWTFNERGSRNIYVAAGPEFTPRRLTDYGADDGQELTNLSFSDDGRYLVYVRGGNHDANLPQAHSAPNPAASPVEPKMQVWSITTEGSDMKLLGEGDTPDIAPRSHHVAFVRDGRIWIAPIDGSKPAESLFAHGTSAAPTWSPDGNTLAFESNRDDHSFIALFTSMDRPIRYLAPSTSRDSTPVWSPDGRQIAFVRQPPWTSAASGLSLVPQLEGWAIWVADVVNESARELWKSGSKPVDALPDVEGGSNLLWGAADRLVFLSYHDRWQHLYSVRTSGGPALLLTSGQFMVEHVSMAPDRRSLVFSANGGTDKDDIDRRHIFRVPVDAAAPVQVTSGRGIEWSPVVVGDGTAVAYVSSDAVRPPQPTILPFDGRPARTIADDRVPVDFPASKLVTPESVIIRAPDGADVHGQVFKSNEGDGQRPALVFVHGGPAQQMLLGWHYEYYYAHAYALNQYLASRGFIVLSVNYRRGIGYGLAFQYPERVGPSVSEYDDVLAAAKYLQTRPDVDPKRIGIWGGSYGGYLTALGLARNSDLFGAGVDVHGPHDLVIREVNTGALDADTGEISPAVLTWTSPVLLIHADDDRNVPFLQTVILEQRLISEGVRVEVQVIPDDIHDFLLFRSWKTLTAATADFFERAFLNRPGK